MIRYLIYSEIEKLLIDFILFFCTKRGCSALLTAPLWCGILCVSWPHCGCKCSFSSGLLTKISTFRVLKLFLRYEIGPMTKWIENTQKKRPDIDIKFLFFKKNIYLVDIFWNCFMTQSSPDIFSPKTCCILNNNKYIHDKALR